MNNIVKQIVDELDKQQYLCPKDPSSEGDNLFELRNMQAKNLLSNIWDEVQSYIQPFDSYFFTPKKIKTDQHVVSVPLDFDNHVGSSGITTYRVFVWNGTNIVEVHNPGTLVSFSLYPMTRPFANSLIQNFGKFFEDTKLVPLNKECFVQFINNEELKVDDIEIIDCGFAVLAAKPVAI